MIHFFFHILPQNLIWLLYITNINYRLVIIQTLIYTFLFIDNLILNILIKLINFQNIWLQFLLFNVDDAQVLSLSFLRVIPVHGFLLLFLHVWRKFWEVLRFQVGRWNFILVFPGANVIRKLFLGRDFLIIRGWW
jgi:hypothetical protein